MLRPAVQVYSFYLLISITSYLVSCEQVKIVGDISKQKCAEYTKYGYEVHKALILHPEMKEVNVSVCSLPSFIISGSHAIPREFPHMALLGFGEPNDKIWLCSGTLISEQYVMTAAHCLNSRDLGYVKWVRLGDYDINTTIDDVRTQEYSISETIRHPQFYPRSIYNDIALLKLNGSATLNRYVKPACLYTGDVINATRVFATGWEFDSYQDVSYTRLKKVTYVINSEEDCKNAFKAAGRKFKNGVDTKTQFCAGGIAPERDDCLGGSGGPVQIYDKDNHCMYDIVGVTSFAKPCFASKPGLYTKVSSYIEWIENIVWQ